MYFTLKEFGPSTRHGGAARFLGRFPRDDLIYFVAYGGSQRLQVAKHQRSRQIHQRVLGDAPDLERNSMVVTFLVEDDRSRWTSGFHG